MKRINNYIFTQLMKTVNKTNKVYRGYRFNRESNLLRYKRNVKEKGFIKRWGGGSMSITPFLEISEYFNKPNGLILEIDASKIKILPCTYNTHRSERR